MASTNYLETVNIVSSLAIEGVEKHTFGPPYLLLYSYDVQCCLCQVCFGFTEHETVVSP